MKQGERREKRERKAAHAGSKSTSQGTYRKGKKATLTKTGQEKGKYCDKATGVWRLTPCNVAARSCEQKTHLGTDEILALPLNNMKPRQLHFVAWQARLGHAKHTRIMPTRRTLGSKTAFSTSFSFSSHSSISRSDRRP